MTESMVVVDEDIDPNCPSCDGGDHVGHRPECPVVEMSEVEARMAAGLCVLRGGRCLTHSVADTMDHHFEVHPNAYND